jgi:hypothetical protein
MVNEPAVYGQLVVRSISRFLALIEALSRVLNRSPVQSEENKCVCLPRARRALRDGLFLLPDQLTKCLFF